MLSSSDFGATPADSVGAPDGRAVPPPHTGLLAEALRQWFGLAASRIDHGQRADLVFREAIDMACARAWTDGISIERLIVAVRTSLAREISTLPAERQSALIDTIISDCIERFYRVREEISLDSRDA